MRVTQNSNVTSPISGNKNKNTKKAKEIMRKKKVLLANKGMLSHESIVFQCPPKKEQSP